MTQRLIALALLAATVATPVVAQILIATPVSGPADQPMRLGVEGLSPVAPVELKLSMVDKDGVTWSSRATFHADPAGLLDTAAAGAESGSYAGLDAMGLFWSMTPEGKSAQVAPLPMVHTDDGLLYRPATFTLEAFVGGKSVGARTIERTLVADDVVARPLDVPGLVANVYQPRGFATDGKRHPAVITLGGAEGGIESANRYAAWLASNGFVGVAVAYYRMPGLPKDLVRVPIDVVSRAIDWLSTQPMIDAKRIGVMGGSWGGIVSLATASMDPRLHAVVSWVGSPVPFAGIERDVAPADFHAVDEPALTYGGKPFAFVPLKESMVAIQAGDLTPFEAAALPLERINGPVMMVVAGDDQLAFSGRFAPIAERKLAGRPAAGGDRTLYFSNAGHLIDLHYQPTTQRMNTGPYVPVGGTPRGYARAGAVSGPTVLAFLHKALRP